MKRKAVILIVCALALCMGLAACADKNDKPKSKPDVKYSVSYEAGGGTGDAPVKTTYKAGTEITVADNTFFTYTDHVFDGWAFGSVKYAPGDKYIVNADTVFTATWVENGTEVDPPVVSDGDPHFTQTRYTYDRIGGGDLELPFVLDGTSLFYVRFDDDMLDSAVVSYDGNRGAIVISSEFVLDLALGSYTVTAITNSKGGDKQCAVEITQSLKTTFDDETVKSFVFGKSTGVTFNVGYNRTTPTKLMQGDITVPSEFYEYDAHTFTIKSEWLEKSAVGKYKLFLSNFDRYEFTVTSNIIFATDYDVSIEHDTTMSNTGQNPLYQFYDSVAIVDSPSEMNSGKALEITYDPGTEIMGGLHNYITLRTPECGYTWRRVEFRSGRTYYISFDYMTRGTAGDDDGRLFFGGTDGEHVKRIDMDGGNDDIVHHFGALYTYDEIGLGVRINSRFPGGGKVYIDNYKVVELDGSPVLGECDFNASGDYVAAFDPSGYEYTVKVDGKEVEHTYGSGNIVISAAEIAKLMSGEHVFTVSTPVGEFNKTFRVTDDRVAEFTPGTVTYRSLTDTEVKVYGSFDETIELVSLRQKAKQYDNGYGGGWNFTERNDTTTNFASQVTLKTGLNGAGYLTVPKAFMDKFWGEVTFIAEFDNGKTSEFTINSANVAMFTDYDASTLYGYINGEKRPGSPLNSGLWGNSAANIEDRGDGNKALFIRSTEGAADNTAFTTKYMEYKYEWYRVIRSVGDSYRVTFDYQINGFDQGDVYFDLFFAAGEDINDNYFGEGGVKIGDELVFDLIADGKVHTFDSGWFTHDETMRLSKINFPQFTSADGKFIMLDDYRVVVKSGLSNIVKDASDYDINEGGDYTLDTKGMTVDSVTIGGKSVEFAQNGNMLTIAAAVMNALELGRKAIVIETADGAQFRGEINIINSFTLSEFTTANVAYNSQRDSEIKVYGSFTEGITLTSLKQKAKQYDNGYGGWDFTGLNDTTTNFASRVTLKTGLDGAGYLTIPKAFMDNFWGEVTFVAEFSNGKSAEFTVNCVDVLMYTNYDESTLYGYLNGVKSPGSPLNSGLWGGSIADIEDRGDGNKALFIRSTEGAGDMAAFTTRFHSHPWDWYNATSGKHGEKYRITFDYRISDLAQDSVYFYIMSGGDEDRNANFFGEYDALDYVSGDDYYKVRSNLIADGQIHTFDSGWFAYADMRMSKIQLPLFTAADNAFVMIDNYRIIRNDDISYILENSGGYVKGNGQAVEFTTHDGEIVQSVKLDDLAIGFVQNGNNVTLDGDDLDALDCNNYTLKVATSIGAYRKAFVISDERISTLTQTASDVVHGQPMTVKLAGEFDPTLNVVSLTRRGSDEWDGSKSTPTAMNKDYITLEADGLTLAKALIDQAYGATTYYVTFDNGKTVEFMLTSNLIYYTNYDETRLFETNNGNVGTCQDTAMWRVGDDGNGNNRLEYRPELAVQGHATGAINGGGADNGIMTFSVEGKNTWWKRYNVPNDKVIVLSFDYEIVTNGKTPNFTFVWFNGNTRNETRLLDSATGEKGTFRIEIPAGEFCATYICCPASNPSEVQGCVMYIDNYYFGAKVADYRTAYLTETAAEIVYGQTTPVKLAGEFDTTLTVTSLTRRGSDEWDTSRSTPSTMNKDYVTVDADGVTISTELINQAYGTTTYYLSFDNDKTVEFTLKSNLLFFTNYDETNIFDTRGGNMPSCQVAAMWSVTDGGNGNNRLEYRPELAREGHSTAAINGGEDSNSIFTFKAPSRGGLNWKDYDFPTDGSATVFFFDYRIVAPAGTSPNFRVLVRDMNGTYEFVYLTGAGTFYYEVEYTLDSFMINCPASSPTEVQGCALYIDNFGFGVEMTDERVSVLTETAANVVHGQSETVKLAGTFDPSLKIVSLTRKGTSEWDTSVKHTAERTCDFAPMNGDYIAIAADGLVLSSALVDQAYGTTTYKVAFDNGRSVEFTLNSNLVVYTNYDETYVFDTRTDNTPSCQDTNMWGVVADEYGNHRLEYRPERAELWHSLQAINGSNSDNSILMFIVEGRSSDDWMTYSVPDNKKIIISFDYEIVTDGKTPNFTFVWWNMDGGSEKRNEVRILDQGEKGTFYLEIPADVVLTGAKICCPASNPAEVQGCVMYLDNYYIGVQD